MNINIQEKIEKIRQKPEHIRIRWAWGLTALFMLIVFALWGILISAERKMEEEPVIPENQRKALMELQNEKKSIEDTMKEMNDTLRGENINQ